MIPTITPIKIIIADSHELLREGFKAIFKKSKEIEVSAEVENGKKLISAVEKHKPHIVLIDIQTPVLDGLQACKRIHDQTPWINLIALASNDEESLIIHALKAGFRGYLLKNATKDEVIHGIKKVNSGEIYYCNS